MTPAGCRWPQRPGPAIRRKARGTRRLRSALHDPNQFEGRFGRAAINVSQPVLADITGSQRQKAGVYA